MAPRVGKWESHGEASEPSVRNIDNLLFGEQNNTVGTTAAHRPTDVDALVALTRAVAETFHDEPLAGWSSDFAKAFTQAPAAVEQIHLVAIVQWEPEEGRPVYFLSCSQVFRSGSAPLDFSRHAAWCVDVIVKAFAIPCGLCGGDLMSVERR